ncbi:MAG: class I SAM-dependent methyltransferase [Desulfobacteraceae bacterium]|nr:class I SAM-dependent methyltransferase [Desulfobacteraceae bacterium]
MDNFAEKMADILNCGALNLAMAIGYKNRIFDTLEDMGTPATAAEIAAASGLNERYLKEWLAIMVTGEIITPGKNEKNENTYYLPPEHASSLTRKSGNNNLGVYTQEIPLLTSCAMKSVIHGFQTGEGIAFSQYPDFQQFMSQLADAKHEQILLSEFLPSVENGKLVEKLKSGIRVCDLGCGHGVALNLMAGAFPKSQFTGIDNHEPALETARKNAEKKGLSNLVYKNRDAAKISGDPEFDKCFDYICAFDAIHDQSHPLEALKGIRYMLAPGGLFSMVDIKAQTNPADNMDHPMGPFLYTVSLMHCMPVGLNHNGTGLGMMWGREQAEAMLARAGFEDVRVMEMAHDGFNLHYLCKVPENASLD